MRPRGWPLQGVDKGCQKGAQAGHNLLEDLRGDLTFLKQLRFSNGVSGVHGSAPSGAHIFVSRPQKEFIHNDLEHVNEAKTVEVGSVRSPLLANIYLHELDTWAEKKWDLDHYARMKNRAAGRGNYRMVRYADDFVVVSNGSIAEVKAVKEELKDFLSTSLHLELSEEKTRITHINDGIDFLGFNIQRVNPEGKWVVHLRPTEKGTQRIKKKIKDLSTRGWTWLDEYIQLTRLNALVRGWSEYYKHTSLLEDIEEVTKHVWFRHL